jgi:hypothetical protein
MFIEKAWAAATPAPTSTSAVTTNLETVIAGTNFFKFTNIGTMVTNILMVGMSIAAVLTLLFIVWGAIDTILSGGDKQKYESARNKITYALVGLAIVVLSWGLWWLSMKFFGLGTLTKEPGQVELNVPTPGL